MIANDQQLQTTLERISWFQNQVAHLRKTETNPVNYRASASGFLAIPIICSADTMPANIAGVL